jgi:hypothetical protein
MLLNLRRDHAEIELRSMFGRGVVIEEGDVAARITIGVARIVESVMN